MNEYRLAICDDEEVHIENIRQYLAAYESESGNHLVITSYASAIPLLKDLKDKEEKYDILFLDVDMPDMQGTDAAMEIRKFDKKTIICFITSYENYAYQAYQVDAVGYMVKPVTYASFKHTTDKIIVQIEYERDKEAAEDKYFSVKTERSQIIISVSNILYIEKRRNKCVFHLTDREVTCYDTLSNVYARLNPQRFYYVHQGYIVNFDHIKEVLPDKIYLSSDLEVPVSRKYYKEMRELHMNKLKRFQAEKRAGII